MGKKRYKKKCVIGPLNAEKRNARAYKVRNKAAKVQEEGSSSKQQCNGDEGLYSNKLGNFSKGLQHNPLGEVDLSSYDLYIKALKSGKGKDFESIPMGDVVKLANPQAAYVYDLIGADCHKLGIAVPPTFSSAWAAGEMVELYWQALTRDVPFAEYDTHPLTTAAASELSVLSDFHGPKVNGSVTTGTLFRGNTPGDLAGPYLSQLLWMNIPFGAKTITQQYRTTPAGSDYMTNYDDWWKIQNGVPPVVPEWEPTSRYITNGRDLAEYVHLDFSFQASLSACLILLGLGKGAIAESNPYLQSATEGGFITFGAPHIQDLVTKVARVALEAAWYQKFLVHRRLRPEEFGGRVHLQKVHQASYPIHNDLLNSQALSEVYKKFGTYLLPMAYPEGCPTHPAYPAGHACIIGAGVTVLKAFFNESFVLPNPVVVHADGQSLIPYEGEPLTIGGELNKLASNIALSRDTAGVHWRSDGSEGLKLGEIVAIEVLKDFSKTYNEKFSGFTLTKFDGTTITIH